MQATKRTQPMVVDVPASGKKPAIDVDEDGLNNIVLKAFARSDKNWESEELKQKHIEAWKTSLRKVIIRNSEKFKAHKESPPPAVSKA